MLSKIQELTQKRRKKDVKFLIIPYILYYSHKGATLLGQVRISPKGLLSNRRYLPCAIRWRHNLYRSERVKARLILAYALLPG